jgi:hypothetical protein
MVVHETETTFSPLSTRFLANRSPSPFQTSCSFHLLSFSHLFLLSNHSITSNRHTHKKFPHIIPPSIYFPQCSIVDVRVISGINWLADDDRALKSIPNISSYSNSTFCDDFRIVSQLSISSLPFNFTFLHFL